MPARSLWPDGYGRLIRRGAGGTGDAGIGVEELRRVGFISRYRTTPHRSARAPVGPARVAGQQGSDLQAWQKPNAERLRRRGSPGYAVGTLGYQVQPVTVPVTATVSNPLDESGHFRESAVPEPAAFMLMGGGLLLLGLVRRRSS